MIRLNRVALAAVIGVFAVAGAASAQQPSAGGPQQPDLSAMLHLSPGQMTAFHAFEAAGEPRPDELTTLRAASPQALAAVPTPERLKRIDAVLATQQQMFHREAAATLNFYGQLNPEQKKTFDQVTAQGAEQAGQAGR